jgi:hypothetical protein
MPRCLFYLFPTTLGALGRRYAPDLRLTGRTDATRGRGRRLPLLVLGIWRRALTAAGAIAGVTVGGWLAHTAVIVTITLPAALPSTFVVVIRS